jgi:hypothetical protein
MLGTGRECSLTEDLQSLECHEETSLAPWLMKANPGLLSHQFNYGLSLEAKLVCHMQCTGSRMGRAMLKWLCFIKKLSPMRAE